MVFLMPLHARAGASFTTDGIYPYANGITLRINDVVVFNHSIKTNQDIAVTLSVDPGTAYPSNNISVAGGETYIFKEHGTTTYTFHFEDSYGNTGSSTVTIDNIDRVAPVITVDPYTTATTNANVAVTASTNEGTLATSTHTFSDNGSFDFVATDEAGNIATSTVTITHIDRDPPVLSLTGESSVSVRLGSSFADTGATALDTYDGAVVPVVSGSVNTQITGTYVLTYTATDHAGNQASTTRSVEVYRRSGGGGNARVIAIVDPAPTIGRVLGASTYTFTRDLELGLEGIDVTELQKFLAADGYFAETPTGYFGPKTKAALMKYQAARNIRQTGVLGPITRAAFSGAETPSVVTATDLQIAVLMAQIELLRVKLAALTGV